MELITIRLSRLGENCLVSNAEGKMFIDLSKVPSVTKGYNDELEFKFTVRKAKKKTSTGKQCLLVSNIQTREEVEAKQTPVWIGDGIILYEETAGFQSDAKSYPKPDAQAMPPMPGATAKTSDLPF